MKILALDSATEACSVSLAVGPDQLDRYFELGRGHAERLLPMVDELLAEAGITLAALDAIAFGRGPGAFTGVRLAAGVAQGLAFGAGLGVVPISDLAAVAQRAAGLHPDAQYFLAVNDARMQEVYWAGFSRSDLVEAAGDEQVSSAAEVALPKNAGAEKWIAAGRGLKVAPALADRCRQAGGLVLDDLLPRASEVLMLARPMVAGGRMLPPEGALPVYVRDRVVASAV